MSSVIALIPARLGSKGIPGKNFRMLGGKTLIQHAVDCAHAAGIERVCVSTDLDVDPHDIDADVLRRPPELATDEASMFSVVEHFAREAWPLYYATNPAWTGKPVDQTVAEQICVLLQPTAPLRKPEHVQQAITLLRESGADSVVSVTEWPENHSPEFMCHIMDGRLYAVQVTSEGFSCYSLSEQPTRRQDAFSGWRRDGTVYAFKRETVTRYRNLYGRDARPLIIDPADSCELDTEEQWAELERRWKERHG
jgi:CMP-N,N'-diacetyllegionaminic acid synthase